MPVYLARLFNWFWTRQHCTPESTDPLTCMHEPDVRACPLPWQPGRPWGSVTEAWRVGPKASAAI